MSEQNSEQSKPIALDCALGSYVATFRTTTQIGPCDYEVRPVCRVITPDTTIAELIAWYRSSHPTVQLVFEIVEAT